MSEGNIAIRLKGFMENQGLSYSQFADACKIPRPSLSQILNGRNKKISDIILTQIHEAFPELSIAWLLFGEGNMFGVDKSYSTDENDDVKDIAVNISDNLFDVPAFSFDDTVKTMTPQRETVNSGDKTHSKGKQTVPPRKVVSITVFYDDNSYEVFSSAKK